MTFEAIEGGRYFIHVDQDTLSVYVSWQMNDIIGTDENPHQFTGRQYDAESGLYHYRARAYSADIGRFMQQDPAGMADGANVYVYCGNDPVNKVDPSGTWSWPCYRFHKYAEDVWYYSKVPTYYFKNDKWAHCFISGYFVRYNYYYPWTMYSLGVSFEIITGILGKIGLQAGVYSTADMQADHYGCYTAAGNFFFQWSSEFCKSVGYRCKSKYPVS